MKRKLIHILIGLLSVSIAGIIAVQIIWINNAIRVKDELFARNAAEALQNTVKRMENFHDFTMINRMAFPDSAVFINRNIILPAARGVRSNPSVERFEIQREFRNGSAVEFHFRSDSPRHIEYNMITADTPGMRLALNSRRLPEDVLVVRQGNKAGFDSLMTMGLQRLDSLSDVLDTLARGVPQIHIRAAGLQNLTRRAVSEIVALDRPEIDPANLENILEEELVNRNIPIPFQFGVLRDSTLLLASDGADTTALSATPLRTDLYPNSLFRRNQQLALYFPGRESFIYRSMSWLLAASMIFSAIVLITFSASILVLLRQKKISEMKSDFINNMTHEFKTPIATIAVAADSLLNEKVNKDPGMVRYFSGMIRKENQRMDRQVEDILTIARLEKKELEFRWETFDVHEILNEAIESIQIQVNGRGGQILSVFEATRPLVLADRQHLTHAMFNLLDNANKYSPEAPRIVVKTNNNESGIVVSVTDNGTGMSRQIQSRIFERFYRQPSGNIHNVKGFGLGLSYVRAVVETCRGNISVQSEPGKGSTFELFLPYNT